MKKTALIVLFLVTASCASKPEKKELTQAERAQIQLELASSLFREGDLIGTLEYCLRAEKLDPKNAAIFHLKALALYGKSQMVDAVNAAKQAITLKPDFPDAHNTLGKMLMDQGKLAEAESHLMSSADSLLYRESYKPNTNLGILYYRTGRFADSKGRLQLAIKSAPDRACQAYYYLGHLELRNARANEGLGYYEKATKGICGSFSDAHLAVGIALERKKDFAQARAKYIDIARLFADTPVADQAMDRIRKLPQ